MARLESTAVGGYFPLPVPLLPLVRSYYGFKSSSYSECKSLDPCAGEGTAISFLGSGSNYGIEMERNRYEEIARKGGFVRVVHSDFFSADIKGSFNFLYLNPPYHTDPKYGRLEERFLAYATRYLYDKGLLVFVVPHYALAASADTLARYYESISCYRFPEGEWGAYKQVVLFAKRKGLSSRRAFSLTPMEEITRERVLNWSNNADSIPVIEKCSTPVYSVPYGGPRIEVFQSTPMGVDWAETVHMYNDFAPWLGKGVPSDIEKESQRVWPVASKPRSSHVSAALSAGLFNGVRLKPTEAAWGLPDLLIKGTFDKVYIPIEDKYNKDGEKIGEVQVEQPSMLITILDLESEEFHELPRGDDVDFDEDIVPAVSEMTFRHILHYYGPSLMARMLSSCPAIEDDPSLPDVDLSGVLRKPYAAQEKAIQTTLKLFRMGHQRTLLIGEIGVGKTGCVLTTIHAMKKKRPLIVCPPHLLDGWADEVDKVLPDCEVRILDSISAARDWADAPATSDRPCLGILSREKAKLGFKYMSHAGKTCPSCGGTLPKKYNWAKKREGCPLHKLKPLPGDPTEGISTWVESNIRTLFDYLGPKHPLVAPFVEAGQYFGRFEVEGWTEKEWVGFADPTLKAALVQLSKVDLDRTTSQSLAWIEPNILGPLLYVKNDRNEPLLMGCDFALPFAKGMEDYRKRDFIPMYHYIQGSTNSRGSGGDYKDYERDLDGPRRGGVLKGSRAALSFLCETLLDYVKYEEDTCDEPLFYAVPMPRRFPIATWIKNYRKDAYDFIALDESHEHANENSAQTLASMRLQQNGAQCIHMTGSSSNGYSSSLFNSMRLLSPDFAEDFGRTDKPMFVDMYGYRKRLMQEKDAYTNEIVEYGSSSDRTVVKSSKKGGEAPGVMPLFLLKYLLPIAVTLHKADLDVEVPPSTEETLTVPATDEQNALYEDMSEALFTAIRENRQNKDRNGRLWGAVARLPSFFDLILTGNNEDGTYRLAWPENTPEIGGAVIWEHPRLSPAPAFPKELELINRIKAELTEGRRCIVFPFHKRVMARLYELIEDEGIRVKVLDAAKVSTGKRIDWINKNVVKKDLEVLLVNPMAVQTGLNNLVHFSTAIWYENPMCNANVRRQASGRIDRIGQRKPTRMVTILNQGAPEAAQSLLMHKVAVGRGVDGLDPEAALRAAGIIQGDAMDALSVGKQLYKILSGE